MTKTLTENAAKAIPTEKELPEEIIRRKDLWKYTGVGKTATDKLLEDGKLRPGIPLSDGRAVGWFKSWLVEYQQSLIDNAEARSAKRKVVTERTQKAAAKGRERKARALRQRGKQAAAKSSKRRAT
jgi:predicted DNA-binding transcriptional regulator AlpA